MNILFVCTGNTCRSPMAEALFKSAASQKNLDVSVKSAGLFAPENGKASLYAVEALFEKNIALNHSSARLSREKVEWADLVLTMTEQHKLLARQEYSGSKDKIFTLKEYIKGETGDIADPFGGSLSDYQKTRDELEGLLKKLAEKLSAGEQ
ncbi:MULTISPECIES: low molecular weight protein arginine phosphatase [Bacillus]|uniref:low molecular weight protein arginine phosphatase n=1 Tax=Bacillus TaxID=1386 RepID=UPI0004266F18|nr:MULTISPECIES: low molecular weight protein arginine phosphatase [Bacillus]QHZ45280.1 low molecular weight protein arginine phosphatase [Bacillus sp. NSP9.1]WFA04925.1 low molecular weight protein arginine phosphatase [Bacillus sp. HSf4]